MRWPLTARPYRKSLLREAMAAQQVRQRAPQELTGWVRRTVEVQRRDVFLQCLMLATGVALVLALVLVVWMRLSS